MAKLDYSKIFIKDACPTAIGGQAIMEGVMMQGPDRLAIAMRLPSGELYLKTKAKPAPKAWAKMPFVRGVFAFIQSLIVGTSTLMESADILEKYAPDDYAAEPSKFEMWMDRKFGPRAAWNALMTLSVVMALVITILGFVLFPTWVINILGRVIKSAFVLNLFEGIFRILLFVGYVVAIRKMQDIKTLFRYHGSEHKTIHCFENGLELTPENAQQFYTLHPRCGTSFLVFVLIISLLLFSFLGWPNLLMRFLSRLLLLPVIAGISYELLKWAGRSDGNVVRALSYPGLMLQKLTTDEPTLEQLEVAILSLKAVLVDPSTPYGEGFVDKDGNWLDDLAEFMPDHERKSEAVASDAVMKAAETKELTVGQALRWGELQLMKVENGKSEARTIFTYITGLSRSEFITKSNEPIDPKKFEDYEKRIRVRLKGVPMQYIIGMQQFMGLPFRVNKHVLIPRHDTETLVENVVKVMEKKAWLRPEVIDMCTGSGAIGISIAHLVPNAVVTMTDVSEEALKTADGNAHLNKVNRRCIFSHGDMFEAIPRNRKYDVFLCNPPYIETRVIDTLQTEVKDYEPRLALDGGADGLDFYRRLADNAPKYINSGGIIALEIGDKQARAVKRLLDETEEFGKVFVIKDLAGLDRVVIAEKR